MSRRSRALVVAAAMVFGLGVPIPEAGAQAACTVSSSDQAIDSVEYDLFTMINDYRVQNGRQPLSLVPDLNRSAAWFSRDMATRNYFPADHVDSNGRDIPTRMQWCGAEFTAWRENIAANSSGAAIDIFNTWKNSSVHNTNMLATDVTVAGIGRAYDATSQFGYYFTLDLSNSHRVQVANFDGDLDDEVGVFRPSNGVWYVGGDHPSSVAFGQNGDTPVPADYNDDGATDRAVFRPSTGVWYVATPSPQSVAFGANGDVPVPADYNNDGAADIAVFRSSNSVWYIMSPASSTAFGTTGDIPVPGDYDGDGQAEPAVFRPSNGVWYSKGTAPQSLQFGTNGDTPVPGDYDGDGATDQAVFRPSTNTWYLNTLPAPQAIVFGRSGDIPVPADYNGDGKTDIAVFRPSTGVWYVRGVLSTAFGQSTDIPLSAAP